MPWIIVVAMCIEQSGAKKSEREREVLILSVWGWLEGRVSLVLGLPVCVHVWLAEC